MYFFIFVFTSKHFCGNYSLNHQCEPWPIYLTTFSEQYHRDCFLSTFDSFPIKSDFKSINIAFIAQKPSFNLKFSFQEKCILSKVFSELYVVRKKNTGTAKLVALRKLYQIIQKCKLKRKQVFKEYAASHKWANEISTHFLKHSISTGLAQPLINARLACLFL